MGDDAAALRVLTCFETTDAVIDNIGASLTRGSIRVPIQLKTQAPFEVVLETRSGLEAVRGSAMVVEHAGDATWIRFLSAADHQGDDARWILSGASVVLLGSLRETTKSKIKTEQFEAITKVNPEGEAIEAIRAGNAEPTPLAPLAPMMQVAPILPRAPILPTTPRTQALKSKLDRKFDLSTGEAQPLRVAALAKSSGLAPTVEIGSVIVAADADLAIPVEPAQPIGFVLAKPATDVEPAAIEPEKPAERSDPPVEMTTKVVEPEPPVNGAPKAVITESAEPMVMEPESSTRPTEQVEPLRIDRQLGGMPPLEIPESMDAGPSTISVAPPAMADLSPIQRTPVAVLTAGLDLDPTKPNPMPADDAHDSDREAKRRAHTDLIARERGIRPIAQAPKRTELEPRQIMIVSAGVAAACLIATISTIVWARGAVSDARAASKRSREAASAVPTPARQPEPAIDRFPSGSVTPPAPGVAGQVDVVAPIGDDAPAAPDEIAGVKPLPGATFDHVDCAVSVSANVSGSTVFVDGKPRGTAPTEISAPCDAPLTVEVRHPRYENFTRTVTPSGGKLEIAATLERAKTALTVWSDPPAQVVYNGTLLGTTPLTATVPRFEQGTLRFRAKGMAPDWRRILPKSATKTVSVTLTKK